MTLSFRLLLALLVFAMGCSSKGVLTVSVQTSLVPGRQFDLVDVSIVDSNPVTEGVAILRHGDVRAVFEDDYLHGKRVAEFSDIAAGETVVRVRLMQPDGLRLLERRVRVTIAEGGASFSLVVRMSRDCLDVTCPNASGDAALSECLAGQCVDERCNPPSRDFCPPEVFCNVETDCPTPPSCAVRRCLDGLCEAEPVEGACMAGEWCDPSNAIGCIPVLDNDAGVLDGGADAAMDADIADARTDAELDANIDGGPVCGTVCQDGLNACHFGYWDCSSGTPTCSAILPRWAGSACGTDSVCDGHGACVACESGAACLVDGCIPGTVACGSGAAGCVASSPALDPGTECAANSVCTSTGACVFAPDHGDACDENCAHGNYDYATGVRVCVADGTSTEPGTSCGENRVCDTAGSCSECAAFTSCITDCWYGIINCGSGVAVCEQRSPTPPGAACAGGICDGSGTCLACVPGEACDVSNPCQRSQMECTSSPRCAPAAFEPIGIACDSGICNGQGSCVEPLVARSMRMGTQHACAIMTDRTMQCWGSNAQGERGLGTTTPPFAAPYFKSVVPGMTDIDEVALDDQRTCARSLAGDVWCWGINSYGQLGDGTTTRRTSPTHVTLPSPAIDIAVSYRNTCAVLSDHNAYCWGYGASGALGNGLATNATTPSHVTGVTDAASIELGWASMCILRNNGHVACSGTGGGGDGTARALVVADVPGIDEVMTLAPTPEGYCAVRTGGRVSCWSSTIDPDLTLPFTDSMKIAIYADGPYNVRCILRANGQVWCDGPNALGELGRGYGVADPPSTWGAVSYIETATDVIPYSCAGVVGGFWECWGNRNYYYGIYGTGTYMDSFYYPTLAVATP
jgi:hypothetical protein